MKTFASQTFKQMKCRNHEKCGETVEKVDHRATSVICWKCVNEAMANNIPFEEVGVPEKK